MRPWPITAPYSSRAQYLDREALIYDQDYRFSYNFPSLRDCFTFIHGKSRATKKNAYIRERWGSCREIFPVLIHNVPVFDFYCPYFRTNANLDDLLPRVGF